MNIKCRLLVTLANRQAFSGPIPPDLLLKAVPVEESEFDKAEEALEEICSNYQFVCRSEEGVVLNPSEYPELVGYIRQNGSKHDLRCVRKRRP